MHSTPARLLVIFGLIAVLLVPTPGAAQQKK
jgi:hypothetical protein